MKNKLLLSDTVLVIEFRHDFTRSCSENIYKFFSKSGSTACNVDHFFL
jgi:hypothetical protein